MGHHAENTKPSVPVGREQRQVGHGLRSLGPALTCLDPNLKHQSKESTDLKRCEPSLLRETSKSRHPVSVSCMRGSLLTPTNGQGDTVSLQDFWAG